MKKLGLVLVILCLLTISFTGNALAASVNGNEVAGEQSPAALTCSIQDESGSTVTNVHVSNPWSYDVVGYWVRFGGATWTKATVIIAIKNSDLPEKKITEKYSIPAGYAGSTLTPFAITDWAGVLSYGTGAVTVKTDVGSTTCSFTILPY